MSKMNKMLLRSRFVISVCVFPPVSAAQLHLLREDVWPPVLSGGVQRCVHAHLDGRHRHGNRRAQSLLTSTCDRERRRETTEQDYFSPSCLKRRLWLEICFKRLVLYLNSQHWITARLQESESLSDVWTQRRKLLLTDWWQLTGAEDWAVKGLVIVTQQLAHTCYEEGLIWAGSPPAGHSPALQSTVYSTALYTTVLYTTVLQHSRGGQNNMNTHMMWLDISWVGYFHIVRCSIAMSTSCLWISK